MFEDGGAFVADPTFFASILEKDGKHDAETVKQYLYKMRSTAKDQLEMGFIDEIIEESENPHITARNVYYALSKAFIETSTHSDRKRMAIRDKRIRGLRAFTIVQEEKPQA